MENLAIIYWSATGNTETMANAILAGTQQAGASVQLFNVSDITPDSAAEYSKFVLGCPSMGAEVLEEGEFEPFFTELESRLSGKKIALFGSYGWGDGEWMRDWKERVTAAGAQLYNDEGLIINETPDDDGLATCEAFGKGFAAF